MLDPQSRQDLELDGIVKAASFGWITQEEAKALINARGQELEILFDLVKSGLAKVRQFIATRISHS